MSRKFDDLTRFIPAIENDGFGKWIVDHENDGTPEHPIQFPFVNYSECVRELEHAVYECCKIKGHVVEIDPKEKGIRAYLNYGHTLGHAIEKLCNFSLGHGQCVALGMVCAGYLSVKLSNITEEEQEEVIKCLKLYNLPTSVSGLNSESILEASKSDKKMTGKKIKFTVLKAIGEADSYLDFTDEDLLEAIDVVLD